ncbi:MAG: Zn-dependent alcohol dehydrogenase [Sphingomonadales bacterium]|nr:Zn-dependent alcohol dehydrogenase [Sphingomonadaceae bacterium]MBS3932534.1 Zn-dependent alcohol dehydrogenase [Sphingomonadales bacterium]
MKAALLTRFGAPFEVVDDVEIDSPREGEVLVKISHCGVCHSDYTIWEGKAPDYPLPALLGHEAAGVIAELGPGVTEREVGQAVILTMRAPCGQCYQCTRGNPVLCEKAQATASRGPRVTWRGKPVMRGFNLGAFAEYVLVDVNGSVPIAQDTPLDVAAVVGCAVQTGVGAVTNIAKLQPGESVLIIGAGSVGMSVVQGAVLGRASIIAVVDPLAQRREQALSLGATHVFDSASGDVADEIKRLTAGRGADHAFDLVSIANTVELALAATRPAARIVLIGVPGAGGTAVLPTSAFVMAQKQMFGCILGNCHPQRDLPRFLELFAQGRLPIDKLITAHRPLFEINAAFEDMAAGRGLRTLLDIQAN